MDVIIVIAALCIIMYGVHFAMEKLGVPEKKAKFVSNMVFVILIVGGLFGESHLGKKYGETIGSIFEKPSFDSVVYYYVNAFPDKDNSKNYRVKAAITKDEGEYHIFTIDWSNGGETTFENEGYDIPLILDEKVEIKDDDDKTWWIELTTEKAD